MMMSIDWGRPIEWVSSRGSVEKVAEINFNEDRIYPYELVVDSGHLHAHEDGRLCVDGCGYLRNVAEAVECNEQFGQTPSLRDQFAMAALVGILASEDYGAAQNFYDGVGAATRSYEIADAMLAERERGQ